MTQRTKELLESIESWPEEDQDELLEAARDIQARRTGVYQATQEELAAIDEALKSADDGHFATEEEVAAVRRAKFHRA